LHKAIHSRPAQEWVRAACAMIVGRLVYSGSKLALSNCGAYSSLWETCGIQGEIDVNTHCYDAMDKLFARQDAIQKSLAKKHLENGMIVLYDITSCYVEGEYANSELVEFGYNRDKKRGHAQIIIALLCNKDGGPVAVEVLRGNTKDETTVLDKIDELKHKFGLEKVVFVGDRGMITEAKFEQIDHNTVKVISALSHGGIQKLLDKDVVQLSLFDEKNIVEVIDGNLRYMLCKNPIMAAKEAETRKKLLKKTTEELDKIVNSTRKTKNPKGVRAGKVVDKYKMAKFVLFDDTDDSFTYRLDEAKIEQESCLDGCYIVFTDVLPEDMTCVETVKTYKSLIQVEQAFRNLKTAKLEVRPVYHKTDDRIKCHVFICMLAYYIVWHMRQRLAPLADSDGVGDGRKYSFDYIIESLKAIRSEDVQFMDAKTKITSTPTSEQLQILNLLRIVL
jgi:transposase